MASFHQQSACFAFRKCFQPRIQRPFLTESQHSMMKCWEWELSAKACLDPKEIRCRSHKQANWICHQCPQGQPHRWQAESLTSSTAQAVHATLATKLAYVIHFSPCTLKWLLSGTTPGMWECPVTIQAHSHAKVWWHTNKRGSFQASMYSRTRPEALRIRP